MFHELTPQLGFVCVHIFPLQYYRLLGTLARNARLLSTYSFWLGWSVGVQIVIDALYLWAFFSQSREDLIQRCIDGSTNQDIQNICTNNFNAGKWTVLVGVVVGLLIQFCEFPKDKPIHLLHGLADADFFKGPHISSLRTHKSYETRRPGDLVPVPKSLPFP